MSTVRDIFVHRLERLDAYSSLRSPPHDNVFSGEVAQYDTVDGYCGPEYAAHIFAVEVLPIIIICVVTLGVPGILLTLYGTVWPSLSRAISWLPALLDHIPGFVGQSGANRLANARVPITISCIVLAIYLPFVGRDVQLLLADLDFSLQQHVVSVSASIREFEAGFYTLAARLPSLHPTILEPDSFQASFFSFRSLVAQAKEIPARLSYMRIVLKSFEAVGPALNVMCVVTGIVMLFSHLLIRQYMIRYSLATLIVSIGIAIWAGILAGAYGALEKGIIDYCDRGQVIAAEPAGFVEFDARLAPAMLCSLSLYSSDLLLFLADVDEAIVGLVHADLLRAHAIPAAGIPGSSALGDDAWRAFAVDNVRILVDDRRSALVLRDNAVAVRDTVRELQNCRWVETLYQQNASPVVPIDLTVQKNVHADSSENVADESVCERVSLLATGTTALSALCILMLFQMAWCVVVGSSLSFTVEGSY